MSGPVSLAARRWDSGDGNPSSHSVRDVLEVAIAKLDAGEINPEHIIIAYGRIKEATNDTGFMQAGTFNSYAQLGLLSSVSDIMKGLS
jgi:hypothetical protein